AGAVSRRGAVLSARGRPAGTPGPGKAPPRQARPPDALTQRRPGWRTGRAALARLYGGLTVQLELGRELHLHPSGAAVSERRSVSRSLTGADQRRTWIS